MTVLGKWDKDIDYNIAKLQLLKQLESLGNLLSSIMPNKNLRLGKRFLYVAIAYLQLTNGMRVSEAIEAMRKYVQINKENFEIVAEKTHLNRPVYVPSEIAKWKAVLRLYADLLPRISRHSIGMFLKQNFGWNTHSLRYAFIKYAIQKGYSAEQIAHITAHKKLQTTFEYSRKLQANELLRKLVES